MVFDMSTYNRTDRYDKIISDAKEEARKLGDDHFSTEHLLLALLQLEDCTANRVLEHMGIVKTDISCKLKKRMTRGSGHTGEIQPSGRYLNVINLARAESKHFGNNHLGSEHLLLGLIREPDGLAGQTLKQCGVKLGKTRDTVLAEQGRS